MGVSTAWKVRSAPRANGVTGEHFHWSLVAMLVPQWRVLAMRAATPSLSTASTANAVGVVHGAVKPHWSVRTQPSFS